MRVYDDKYKKGMTNMHSKPIRTEKRLSLNQMIVLENVRGKGCVVVYTTLGFGKGLPFIPIWLFIDGLSFG